MTSNSPNPIALISRPSKGCGQYTFDTLQELLAWTSRKPYCNETLFVVALFNRTILGKKMVPASQATEFVSALVEAAKQQEESASALAHALLSQVERDGQDCAHWVISAVSKLAMVKQDMQLPEFLEFLRAAMPKAAAGYDLSVAEKS